MKSQSITFTGALLGCVLLATALASRAAQKPKYTVKDVMKAVHKGEDNIGKRVVKGEASKEDIAKMVEYYQSLPLNDPPRGDKADWDKRTAALLKAAEDVKSGKPGAVAEYKEAANCKACHTEHKPADKKKRQ